MKIWLFLFLASLPAFAQNQVLQDSIINRYVREFNRNDEELYPQKFPNAEAAGFLQENIPLFDCPDKQLEQTYYFRWWTFRKHIRETPDGFVITEFLPNVPWSGKYNTIACPAGHHFYEGRWLKNPVFLSDYARFWFQKDGAPRLYSFWAADAIKAFCEAKGDFTLGKELLPELIENFLEWEREKLDSTGLYWQNDDRDGMEVSVSGALGKDGQGYRATINSYQFGDATAIAEFANLSGNKQITQRFQRKAADIKKQVSRQLWDGKAAFFKVIPRGNASLDQSAVRELHGYVPWYFNLPDKKHREAWRQLTDSSGFAAAFGPTTTERRHPEFKVSYDGHECQWNGPSWPFATSQTLTALANYLNSDANPVITKTDYLKILSTYSRSHQRINENGRTIPWIDENLNPFTGDWISRTRLKNWENNSWSAAKGGKERGKDYNHSTFCDLIISGLIGLRPQEGNKLIISPLVPPGAWSYFCLDKVFYHNKMITILYDETGSKYGKGKGFKVFVDGVEKFSSDHIEVANIPL